MDDLRARFLTFEKSTAATKRTHKIGEAGEDFGKLPRKDESDGTAKEPKTGSVRLEPIWTAREPSPKGSGYAWGSIVRVLQRSDKAREQCINLPHYLDGGVHRWVSRSTQDPALKTFDAGAPRQFAK